MFLPNDVKIGFAWNDTHNRPLAYEARTIPQDHQGR